MRDGLRLVGAMCAIGAIIVFWLWLATWSAPATQPAETCVDDEEREQIRALTIKGIDKAFEEQVSHLFDVWMRDDHEQPKRAMVGMQIAISAYIRAHRNALKWNPSSCQ